MDEDALQFVSRFSLPPNSLGYCGNDSAPEKLKKCVIKGSCEDVEVELKQFIVLNPYLKTIAEFTGLPQFSHEVTESYWLGNDQLKKASRKDYDLLLSNFTKQGVPDFLIAELKEKRPNAFIPTHLFQVLHVGVGRASGSVPYNLETINQCMIRWGKVVRITKEKVTMKLHSLKEANGFYELIIKEESFPADLQLIPELKIGDTVAVHWQQLVKILNEDEEVKLSYWTKEVLSSFLADNQKSPTPTNIKTACTPIK